MIKNNNAIIEAQAELARAIVAKDKMAAVIAQMRLVKQFGVTLNSDLKELIDNL